MSRPGIGFHFGGTLPGTQGRYSIAAWHYLEMMRNNAEVTIPELSIEVQVNPEFGDQAAARAEAVTYATVIGRLPTCLRAEVQTVCIHKGTKPFGGGNNNLLIHTGQADRYAASGILEETLVHEAAHTSLDRTHADAQGWVAAQDADAEFISTYARNHPERKDIAESFLPYLAVRHRFDRISPSLANTIAQTIPNRIAYFDGLDLDMYPIALPELTVVTYGHRDADDLEFIEVHLRRPLFSSRWDAVTIEAR